MKLKHVFFSSLLLSVGFTACTNDDFTEISAPVNTSEAIALGENFTIKVGKGATTRAAFDKEEGAFIPYWEEGDKLGAAWVHKVIALDEDDNTIVAEVGTIGSAYKGFYSNSPLALTEGAGTNDGTFATVDEANLFAGAYVLYYPYDKTVSMQGEEIPVAIKSYEFDAANPLKNVSDNMFSYSPVKFVPGGNQTAEFTLKQVPVLFRLRFTPAEELNMDLSDGITINHIVVEARKSGSDVLVEEGAIETATEPTKADYNAPAEDEALADIVKYAGGSTVDHLFITTKGTDNDNYKMLVKSEPTKEEFAFSIMPFTKEADEIVIKVVTDKGTYAKTYEASIPEDAAYIAEFKKAAKEGEVVRVNVVLDVTDPDDVIYTAEEFVDRWDDAIAAGKHVDLEVGTDLVLEEGLACDNVNADITVTGHKLTVPSLNIAKNKGIDFQNAVVVEGDVFTSGASEFTAGDLTAENVEIQGDAKISANKIAKLTVASSGIVELKAATTKSATEPAEIGEIDIQVGTTTSKGKLTYNPTNVELEKMTNAGEVTLDAAMTNPAGKTMTVAKGGTLNIGANDFINEGTMDVNGTISGDGTFKNVPGAVLNINSNNSFKLVNNADADKDDYKGLAAAVVNIAADVTVTANTDKEIDNKGIIYVAGNLTEAADEKLTQTDDNARIIATNTTAKITMEATNNTKLAQGYVVILANGNIVNGTDERVAFNLTSTTTKVPANATTVLVNCDITSAWLNTNSSKNLVIYDSNIEFANNADITLTGSFTVAGDVTVSLASKATNAELTLSDSKTNGINKGASLTLCEDFEFYYGTNWNPAGSFNPNGATAKAADA